MKKTASQSRVGGKKEAKALSGSDLSLLGTWFLFHDMEPDVLEEWIQPKRAYAFSLGEVIYSETQFTRAIGFVLEGEVLVKKGQVELNRIKAGQCFGAAAVFCDSSEYLTRIEARKKSRILFFNAEELTELFKVYPEAALAYMAFLSGRIQFLSRKIEAYTQPHSQDSLLTYLKRHQDAKGNVQIEGGFARLSRELSMSRASLYRALDKLEEEGIIHRSQSLIHIN